MTNLSHANFNNNKVDIEQIATLQTASPFAFNIWQTQTVKCEDLLYQFPLSSYLTKIEIIALVNQCAIGNVEDNSLKIEADKNSMADLRTNTRKTVYLEENLVMSNLRYLRKLLMFRWIWQDALNKISVETLVTELSNFADACINVAKECTMETLNKSYGIPVFKDKKGDVYQDDLAIFSMGKLGAKELNLSSDIDLIFVYQHQGTTDISAFAEAKSISNQQFMTKLGQGIIKILDTHNKDGFVFRVDMRLRPWGDGSSLVIHKKALDVYLTKNARAWERFAWIKARVVNCIESNFHDELEEIIKPFIFKHYIDYSAFSSLREMKTLIENQIAQRQDLSNIKLGIGGIRDIEFIVQAHQLIYGGRYPQLQVKPCLQVLLVLQDLGYLKEKIRLGLTNAYLFLRRLEHAVQAVNDKQTQTLPTDFSQQQNLATTLGFVNWASLLVTLNTHRTNVHNPFNQLITQRKTSIQIETHVHTTQEFLQILDAENQQRWQDFHNSKLIKNLSLEAKKHLQQALQIIGQALILHEQRTGQTNTVFNRVLTLLESICRRSIYLVMLAEHPNSTIDLIPVLSASPWIAHELTQYPVLLDNFIQQKYHHLPSKDELSDIMRQSLLRVEPNDEETLLSVLRLFKKMQVLAVAASDIVDNKSIMQVSDSLTHIAEVVLSTTLNRVFEQLIKQHGYPINQEGESVTTANNGIAIIGYGKLGGFELSYSSDLDLVFLHSLDEMAMSNGNKPISGMQFATKLVRKMMSYLATQTRDGRAYEIDIRLRPSGNSGMMIVSANAFKKYQLEKAWYWEHQALVRSRAICGDTLLMNTFEDIRHHVLQKKRDLKVLRHEVTLMREKMRSHLGSKNLMNTEQKNSPSEYNYHLKHDAGGMIDIEFIAQYAVLAYAQQHSDMTKWTDNVRIFQELSHMNLWSETMCAELTEDYLSIRRETHILSLQNKKNVVDDSKWLKTRERIIQYWQSIFDDKNTK